MAFTKITKEDYNGKGVIGLPDAPQLSTTIMQEKFEELSTDVIIPKHNELIDELEAFTGASNIGTKNGNVQSDIDSFDRKIVSYNGDIAQLKSDMATAQADIVTNASEIATNKTAIEKNKTDIATNKADIVANKADISKNKTDIATNKTNIEANKTEIDSLKATATAHNTRISSLEADNTTNKAKITSLDTDVKELKTLKHTHTNKSVLDALSKDSDGDLNFEGKKIEGGGSGGGLSDAYSHIKVGSVTLDAIKGDTLELVAGSNVILTPDAAAKTVTIEATGGGGGTSTGDMTKAEFVLTGGTGQVLSAKEADHATEADNATTATNATTADSAISAVSADKATKADQVGSAITTVLEGFNEDADGKLTYKGESIVEVDDALDEESENPVQNKVIAEALKHVSIDVDDEMSETSENPVQNKVITKAISDIEDTIEELTQNYSNPNLLDNAWFTVNQRGQTSYNGKIYMFDRWNSAETNGTYTLTDNGVSVTSTSGSYFSIHQRLSDEVIKAIENKTVTLSMIIDNVLYTKTFTLPSKSESWDSPDIVFNGVHSDISGTTTWKEFRMYGNNGQSFTIKAIKLELGPVSTLTNDVAPNYAEELIKCQTSTADATDTYANKKLDLIYNDEFLKGKNLYDIPYDVFHSGIDITRKKDGTFIFKGASNATYIGEVTGEGESWDITKGLLIDVSKMSNIIISTTNDFFNRFIVTRYNANKVSLGWEGVARRSPVNVANCHYITVRVGSWNDFPAEPIVSGIQVEEGSIVTDFTPYVMSNAELTKEIGSGNEPTVSQITFTSGSSTDATNCTIVDYGSYCIVNVSAYTGSRDAIMLNLPRPALVKTTVKVPYNNYAMSALTVEANSTEVKIKDYQINNNSFSMLIPLKSN